MVMGVIQPTLLYFQGKDVNPFPCDQVNLLVSPKYSMTAHFPKPSL
jgi:hypothetical protein